MKAFRASIMVLAAAPLAAMAVPAAAQMDDAIVIDILRQCARIDDATARLACFDNNVRLGNANAPRAAVPGVTLRPQTSAPGAADASSGFGREDIRSPDRFETPAGELPELRARVSAVQQQTQGLYLLTLEDGAQWQFSEMVDFAYRPPREGSMVTIDRAALGSFLMTFDNQRSVRIRRVR